MVQTLFAWGAEKMINQRTLALTIRCLRCQWLLAASGCCTARLYFGSLNFLLGGFAGIWLALIWNLEAGPTHFLVVNLFDRTALTRDRRLDVAGEALFYQVWNSAGGGMGPWRELSWKVTGLSTRLAGRLVIHKFCGAWLHHFSIIDKFNINKVSNRSIVIPFACAYQRFCLFSWLLLLVFTF